MKMRLEGILTARTLLTKITIGAILFLNCFSDAPRDNPLDPANGISLSGKVSRFYSNDAIPNATIRLKPGNQISITNGEGSYRFSDISPGMYSLTALTEGFASDTAEINIESNSEINFSLDSLSYFRNISLTSSHMIHWFPPDDMYSIHIETIGEDGDGSGDIDKVWFNIDQINFSDTLQRTAPGSNVFRGHIPALDMPIANLQELIGIPIHFFIKDLPGYTNASTPFYISRIIEETPRLISPVGLSIISSDTIDFRWQAITTIQFPFSHKIEIFSIDLGLKVDEISNINSDTSAYTYNTPLSNGDYYWVLYIVDEFGNLSGSKEGSFRVQL